MAQKLK
jgi:hypothetical protein